MYACLTVFGAKMFIGEGEVLLTLNFQDPPSSLPPSSPALFFLSPLVFPSNTDKIVDSVFVDDLSSIGGDGWHVVVAIDV